MLSTTKATSNWTPSGRCLLFRDNVLMTAHCCWRHSSIVACSSATYGLGWVTTGERPDLVVFVVDNHHQRLWERIMLCWWDVIGILKMWSYFCQHFKTTYSNVGLGSSLRGEPGLTTFRSQGCPWKIISGLRQSDTHRGGTRASSTWQKKPSNCSKSVKKLTLLLAVSQKISAKLFRSWLLGRPRLLCC